MTIRRAAPEDLQAILRICRQCPEAPQWPPSAWAGYLRLQAEPPLLRVALVAGSDARVQGFAAATLLLDNNHAEQSGCELESMAVSPESRRQGVGSSLLESVLAWAAQHGAGHLALEVRAGNLAAVQLYERAGLRIEGRRPRYYADPEEDALLLGIPVTPVSSSADFSTRKLIEGGRPRC